MPISKIYRKIGSEYFETIVGVAKVAIEVDNLTIAQRFSFAEKSKDIFSLDKNELAEIFSYAIWMDDMDNDSTEGDLWYE